MEQEFGDRQGRMRELLEIKHGAHARMGWGPRTRLRFGHYTPDDYYEAQVDSLVEAGTEWLDVGGGDAIFPNNTRLSRMLADRCKRLVAVDPSSNVSQNPFAHERFQMFLENYDDSRGFTLATARMVVEHVAHPEEFVARLGKLVKPGGKAVIYTVDRWAPVTLLSAATPMWFHHAAKKVLWHTEEKDTFPVVYRMNTRSRLRELFSAGGFRETRFRRLDDCRTLARWRPALIAELSVAKALRLIGLRYPESCLLGVYERQ